MYKLAIKKVELKECTFTMGNPKQVFMAIYDIYKENM